MLQEVIQKTVQSAHCRELAYHIVEAYRCSRHQAVRLIGLLRSYFQFQPHPRDDRAEHARIRETAQSRVRYSMWRIQTLMRRNGWLISHNEDTPHFLRQEA